jgi:hypothetical protein
MPCGPATAIATMTGTWTGHLRLPRLTISVTRTGTWTLSGLQTPTVTLAGTSHVDLTSQFASASDQNHKDLTLVVDATYQAVTADRASRIPSGGDIEYAITGMRSHATQGMTDNQSFTVDATLTFHGDGTATLVVDGTRQYEIDLVTGEATTEH